MANAFTSSTFSGTYKDDYNVGDGYHKILFNSGRMLQARELTQLQSILQNQIGVFGKNIFKEGAAVNPGGPSINAKYEFIKLDTSTNSLPSTPSSLVGTSFTGQTSGVVVKVLQVVEAENDDPATLYVQYTDTSSATSGETTIRMSAGENISNGTTLLTVQTTNTTDNPAVGRGVNFSAAAGTYFAQGHFVYNVDQSIILSKYSDLYSGVVGFLVVQDIVTVSDTTALYDNQGATPDLAAPGADRYRITLQLIDQNDVESDQNFVYFAKIVDSVIVEEATPETDYNVINDLLALRTFEESGNYVVKPFKITFEDDSDSSYLDINVTPGTAYINGYRAAIGSNVRVRTPKSQTYGEKNNEVVAANYGNYVYVSTLVGVPNVSTLATVNLKDTVSYGGTTIGTARIRYIEEVGGEYKLYLFDIVMSGTNSFRNVKSIGTSSTNYANISLESDKAVLYETANNSLLFGLPLSRPKSLTDISLEVIRRFTATTNSSGAATLTLTATGETFANTSDWIVVNTSTGAVLSVTISGSGTASASITGAPVSTAITIIAKVNKAQGSVRTKTLTETTVTGTVSGGVLSLGKADIYEVTEIRQTNSSGADISYKFTVDNGQRDNFYDIGKIVGTGTGTVYVKFKYFQHGAGGDFFAVNSYTGQVDYANIPTHTRTDGTVIQLRDVLDFRSVKNTSGTFVVINELPKTTDLITTDITYYKERKDKLLINQNGVVSVLEGAPGFTNESKLPETPNDSLLLYNITMNPYTLSTSDVKTKAFDYKRYTMADIGAIDRKLEELREMTTLSLLELDTSSLAVYDSAGLARTKSGFMVDNFADWRSADLTQLDYRASIDPQNKIMRPPFVENSIRLVYDSDKSTNTILKGDNVYIRYDEIDYITQNQVSNIENVNPFAVITGRGKLTLSPASDNWTDTERIPARVIEGGTNVSLAAGTAWNDWLWNWAGVNPDSLELGDTNSISSTSSSTSTTTSSSWSFLTTTNTTTTTSSTTVARVVSSETIRETIGDSVVDVALIPWMRSVKVYFRAEGLRPNTKFYPFFDGVSVSNWVRMEDYKTISQDPTEYANLYNNATSHPEMSSTLISDENGKIEGSFFIPNTDSIKFRTGTRELKFLDISVYEETVASSICNTDFTSAGILQTKQETVLSTREVTVSSTTNVNVTSTSTSTSTRIWTGSSDDGDPLSQSFYVSENDGVFITKVRAYFNSKDSYIPIRCEIRALTSGVPASSALPGAIKYLNPSDVNLPSEYTSAAVLAAPTDFEFDEPVYLSGNCDYAIVFLAESVEYTMFVSTMGEYILGSTEQKITNQPSLGSLFKSQNGKTWTASQDQDLAFKLYRAEFDSYGQVVLENTDMPAQLLVENPFTFVTSDATVTVYQPNHGFDVNDTVTIAGVTATTNGITAANLNGDRTITAVDHTGYTFEAGSAATSSGIGGGSTVTATRNIVFDVFSPQVQTMIPQDTNITYTGQFTSGKSLAGTETRFMKNSTPFAIQNRVNQYFTAPRMVSNAVDETSELGSGNRCVTINVDMASVNGVVSPVVDLQRSSVFCIHNIIDNQVDSTPDTDQNVPLNYVSETEVSGGSSIAKHICTPITLASDAVGLKIILAANRPSVAQIEIYYRTAGEGDLLSEQEWTLLEPETTMPSDENTGIFREYRYLAGGDGGTLTPFTQFQTKIVMKSSNSSKVPVFKDFRVIAMAD